MIIFCIILSILLYYNFYLTNLIFPLIIIPFDLWRKLTKTKKATLVTTKPQGEAINTYPSKCCAKNVDKFKNKL